MLFRSHGIKGSSRSVGAEQLAQEAQLLEDDMKAYLTENPQQEQVPEIFTKRLEQLRLHMTEMTEQIMEVLEDEVFQEENEETEQSERTAPLPKAFWEVLNRQIKAYDAIAAERTLEEGMRVSSPKETKILLELTELIQMMEYEDCLTKIKKFM